jgi:hypothetical protein
MKMRQRRKGFLLAWVRVYEKGILTSATYWYYKGK